MDNSVKYKLSQYKDIRPLNEEGTVMLVLRLTDDVLCVKRYADKELLEVYEKLKTVKNENIPEIYDVIETENNIVIAEQYIKGRTLEEMIREKGCLTKNETCALILDVCSALKAVHKLNIVHRDISPDNIIITDEGKGFLLDFDISRRSNKEKSVDTSILGTFGFASPEQYGFTQTDARSDIYSAGVLLNYMLTGHIVQEGIYDKAPFKSIINKAVKIDPDMRYRNIESMERDIKRHYIPIDLKSIPSKLISDIKETRLSDIALFPPPGFRSGSIIRMTIALLSYIILAVLLVTNAYSFKSTGEIIDFVILYVMEIIFPMWLFGNGARQIRLIPGLRRLGYPGRLFASAVVYFAVDIFIITVIPTPFI